MDDWRIDVPTSGSKHLPPDPGYIKGLASQGYRFEEAVADLVDNSIDAGASEVVVHFRRTGDLLTSLVVVDNGRGMTEAELDTAMTVGKRRAYGDTALGMFGMGLKAASFSHADSVTVISRAKRAGTVGRRWRTESAQESFQCDIVEVEFAKRFLDLYDEYVVWNGTAVRWDGVRDFPARGDAGQTDIYVTKTMRSLADHLGLHLHRFLADGRIRITIAVSGTDAEVPPMTWQVQAVDPFGYAVSGLPGYPRVFTTTLDGVGPLTLTAHIWTPRSNAEQFRLPGGILARQGLYAYRHDRLVQAGGWYGLRQSEQHLSLARVAFDLPADSEHAFGLTVKKAELQPVPGFVDAVERAVDADGHSFLDYLKDAEGAYRQARTTTRERKAVLPPGKGFAPELRAAIEEELPFVPGEEPIEVRWVPLGGDVFFSIDRDERRLLLNKQFRAALLGGRRGGLNDVPVIKTLLYLLMNEAFTGERIGPRVKDNLDLWQSLLLTAVKSETAKYGSEGGA
ncbi:ATP-binding protein [Embleya hyalina]|uniref:DNA mismatch repair protein MutL n=1 Tax=Embleya hyalina TaxID=516124 RepID=A0A401YXM0_9ACTN|nr:ATP-binding protein [Embleya hyalina]GCD99374.1 DNA mismatch repair protein MutL [Embleya hyalina]